MKKRAFLFIVVLLISLPGISLAWHDYTYHGSGRDYPYSYYIDTYYNAPYVYSQFDLDGNAYLSYINNAAPPSLTPPPPDPGVYTVNVPNNHGGYTPVVIKRSGNGFVGPQGEYYPAFPPVAQLKMMYGQS